jgi:hypothetical protein
MQAVFQFHAHLSSVSSGLLEEESHSSGFASVPKVDGPLVRHGPEAFA